LRFFSHRPLNFYFRLSPFSYNARHDVFFRELKVLQNTQKQGTFTKEISDVLAYYWSVAQSAEESANDASGARKRATRPDLRLVVNKPRRGSN